MKKFLFIPSVLIILGAALGCYFYFASASSLNTSYKGNVTNGLVGWWTFDGKNMTSTTATDSSGNANHGTRMGVTQSGAGRINQGLIPEAVGFTGYVSSTDSNSLDVTNFTLSAWAKRNETSRMDSLISKGPYGLKIGPDSRPYLEITQNTESIADVGQLGANTYVYTLAVYNGKLYGGTFNSGKVYRYDGGTTWADVGQLGANTDVTSLVVYDNQLYGGTYDSGKVYRYDGGTTWTDVGQLGSDTTVRSLAVYNGKLYGGTYNIGGAALVYRYDGGTTWTSTGSPASMQEITSLVTYNGKLYGGFYDSGEVYAYDGSTWQNAGDPGGAANTTINALSVFNGELYAGTATSGKVYRYDGGTTWTDLGQLGADTFVYSLTVYNNKLYAGAASSGNVYRFNGPSSWTALGQLGTATDVNALTVYDGKLYAGVAASGKVYSIGSGAAVYGNTSLDADFNHVAGSYDGTTLKLFINGTLDASSSTSTTVAATTDTLVIGSSHGSSGAGVGEESLKGIIDDARIYNRALSADEMKKIYRLGVGSTIDKTPVTYGPTTNKTGLVGWWTFDAKDLTSTVATDRSGNNNDGTRYDVTTPVAGKIGQGLGFDGASSTVQVADSASLDVTSFTLSTWVNNNELSKINSILSKGSYALKIGADDRPYFEIINNGNATSSVGQLGTHQYVYALAVYNDKLYGGTDADGKVYRYDGGTTWTDLGQLGTNTNVRSLVVYNNMLYGGTYNSGKVYRYDGGTTWTDVGQLGSGATTVYALTVYNGKLYGGVNVSDLLGKVYRYDGGTTWTDVGLIGLTTYPYSLMVYNGKLYTATGGSGIIYRYDGGTTWTSVGTLATYTFELPLVVYNGQMYAGGANNVYRYDGGTTWTGVGGPGTIDHVSSMVVYNGKLYADNGFGNVYRYDGGSTWTDLGHLGVSQIVHSMVVYDGKIFAGTYNESKVYTIGNGEALYGSTALNTGYNHLAATYNGATMKLFVNGAMSTSIATSTTVATNTLPLLIGSSAGSSGAGIGEENLNGVIDDARVYNYSLSNKEIYELAVAGVNTINKDPDITAPLSINTGLVGWWTFNGKDVTNSTTTDRSGNGYHGKRVGTTSPVIGRIGQAMSFTGTSAQNDYIDLPSIDLGTTHSCSVWVKPIIFSGALGTWDETIGNGDSTDYCIFYEYGAISYGVVDGQASWSYTLHSNRWYHLVLTRSGSNATLYINGASQGTQQLASGESSLTVSYISGPSDPNYFPRAVDDVRIYNRILSIDEVRQLYGMGK